MKELLLKAALVSALFLHASSANATMLDFSLTGREDVSWMQDSDPAVGTNFGPDYFTVAPVTLSPTAANTYSFTSVIYFIPPAGGGFATVNGPISETGPQIYTGNEADPHFAPGVFHLSWGDTLTITAATPPVSSVPLPASFYMFATAFMFMAGMIYLKKSKVEKS